MNNQYYIMLGGIGTIIAIVLLTRRSTIKKRNQKEISIIQNHLEAGTGGTGNNSIDNTLNNVEKEYYPKMEWDAYLIYSAKGFIWDDEERVFKALSDKSKGQILALIHFFESEYDRDFDDYIWSFMDDDQYSRAMNIIKNAQ